MVVAAEGVETAAQLDRLVELGCDLAQGYHVAMPRPMETYGPDAEDLLTQPPPPRLSPTHAGRTLGRCRRVTRSHRAARALDGALAGRVVTRFEAPRLLGVTPRPGTTVEGVDAKGKHLLVRFGDGRVLHTHLQMTGSWHLYRPGQRWRKPRHLARVVLEVDDGTTAVCFSAPVVEVLTADLQALGPRARPGGAAGLGTLGPDLCRADADLDEAGRRLAAADPTTEIAVALLDQRIAAGVGNVYKSEVCFACGIDPRTPVGALDDATRRRRPRDCVEPAPRQPRRPAPHDRARRPGRLRTCRPAVPALWRPHPPLPSGAHTAQYLLLPNVPAAGTVKCSEPKRSRERGRMSLLDKAKDAAKTVGDKVSQGVEAGKDKVDEVSTKKKIDGLKQELGGIAYLQRTGNPPDDAEAEIARIVGEIGDLEAKLAE